MRIRWQQLELVGGDQPGLVHSVLELLERLLVDGRHVEDVWVGAISWLVLDGTQDRPAEEVTYDSLRTHARPRLRRLGAGDDLLPNAPPTSVGKLLILLQVAVERARAILHDAVDNGRIEHGYVRARALD